MVWARALMAQEKALMTREGSLIGAVRALIERGRSVMAAAVPHSLQLIDK